jgi:hypothetical protein
MFEKGQRFETHYDNEIYVYVGNWSDTMVLAPENDENMVVLIYTENEIDELIATGELKLITSQKMMMK